MEESMEKRRYERYEDQGDIIYTLTGLNDFSNGRMTNCSMGGCILIQIIKLLPERRSALKCRILFPFLMQKLLDVFKSQTFQKRNTALLFSTMTIKNNNFLSYFEVFISNTEKKRGFKNNGRNNCEWCSSFFV